MLPTVAPDIRAAAAAWGKPPPGVFGRGINPMLELGQNLRRNSTTVALTYTTTAEDPLYLKVATLRDFTGRTWRPGDSLPQDRFEGNLGLRDGVETKMDTTRITIEGLDSPMLPVPYVAQDTRGLEGAWRYERMGMTVRSDTADTRGQDVHRHQPDDHAHRRADAADDHGDRSEPASVRDACPPTCRRRSSTRRATSRRRLPRTTTRPWPCRTSSAPATFRYSETAPVADDYDGNGLSVVAKFLERKAGYCVHFASAMAVMARTIDIPSRIAVGYAPGRVTGVEDGKTVYANTSDDLHAWTELFFEGAGWVRFDPTTSIGTATRFEEPDSATPDESSGERHRPDERRATGTRASTRPVERERVERHGAAHVRRDRRGRPADPGRARRASVSCAAGVGCGPARPTRCGASWRTSRSTSGWTCRSRTRRGDSPRRLGERPGVDPESLERLLHRVELARFARDVRRPAAMPERCRTSWT